MGNSQTSDKKKKVLIIGASFGGFHAYMNLAKQFDVYVVDSKDFFEYTPGIHFSLVSNRSHDRLCLKYEDSIIRTGRFIFGKVVELQANSAIIKTPTETLTLEFDFCLITTGSKYPSPTKPSFELTTLAQRREQVKQVREQIARAKSVLVKGAGIAGVEFAGELAVRGKKVVLSSRDGEILKRLSRKAQNTAKAHLQRIGVTIVNASKAAEMEKNSEFDLVYDCTGNTFPIEDNILNKYFRECRDDLGRVRVNQYMQICDQSYAAPVPHIFAAGDGCLTMANEDKSVLPLRQAVGAATDNIKEIALKKRGTLKLKEFPRDKKKLLSVAVVSMGNKSMIVFMKLVILLSVITYFKYLVQTVYMFIFKGKKRSKKLQA